MKRVVETEDRAVRKRVASLKPSPENEELYDPNDAAVVELALRIRDTDLPMDPLVVTRDNFIVSGHRRHAALTKLGQAWVWCRVLPKRRADYSPDEYRVMLREYNRQREKSVAEQVRETLVDVDRDGAHANLRQLRDKSVNAPRHNGVNILKIEGSKRRYNISEDKADHVKYVLKIVEDRRPYWPLSVRGVHYPLLNFSFVRGYYWPHSNEPDYGTKRVLYYQNDQGSYDATSDLITRLRLNRTIPWEAFDDPTRPVKEFRAFRDVRQFVTQEVENLFSGYWRDLLQSQPNHVECLVEKNTVYHMALQVTQKYQVTTRSARGFNCIDSLHDIYEAYLDSGKERLILIVLSDYDPEGEMIPHDVGRRLRDDFGVEALDVIKAGVTRGQIEKYSLHPQNFAKESSSNYDWFVERNNDDETVWELEALEPADMLADLDKIIRGVIDVDFFNREVATEREEAAFLEASRDRAREALEGLGN